MHDSSFCSLHFGICIYHSLPNSTHLCPEIFMNLLLLTSFCQWCDSFLYSSCWNLYHSSPSSVITHFFLHPSAFIQIVSFSTKFSTTLSFAFLKFVLKQIYSNHSTLDSICLWSHRICTNRITSYQILHDSFSHFWYLSKSFRHFIPFVLHKFIQISPWTLRTPLISWICRKLF